MTLTTVPCTLCLRHFQCTHFQCTHFSERVLQPVTSPTSFLRQLWVNLAIIIQYPSQ